MSEELDFEAEIPAVANNENLIETEVDEHINKVFDAEDAKDNKSEVVSKTREVRNNVDEAPSDTIEIHYDPSEMQFTTEDVGSDNGEIELDLESEIPAIANNENLIETEVNEHINKVFDAEEAKDNESEVVSKTGEVRNNDGEAPSDAIEINTDPSEIQFNTEDVESDNGEIESDTGEILSDSGEIKKGELLEDGEIEDNTPVPNKNPEITCRFFQQGTCFYGTECRNLHVSNVVYNMFDPVLTNKSNFNFLQNVPKPMIFHPPPMIMIPANECPWERGIIKAKIAMKNANNKKNIDDEENYENDWERCLEAAKQSVKEKLYLKQQNSEIEKPYLDKKYADQEKSRERGPVKREYDSKTYKSYPQKSPKSTYSKYQKEEPHYEKKTKPESRPTPDHLKWVDPWQRSKSPRKRIRSMSFSISPSPSRKRSESSSSSSSSCFKRIYGSSQKGKSPKRFRSRSRSKSVLPRSKKSCTSKTRSYNRGRSYSRSTSRSISRSPRKARCSRSCSSSSSSSVSSDGYLSGEKRSIVNKPLKKFAPFKIKSGNERPTISARNSKDHSSLKIHSIAKATGKASSPCPSDKSSCSDVSMTSLSYTSISSSGGKYNSQSKNSKVKERNAFSKSKTKQVPPDKFKGSSNKDQRYPKNDSYNKFSRRSEDFANYKKSSPDRKLLPKDTEEGGGYKVKTGASDPTSKPLIAKIVAQQKPSKAAMELLKYQTGDPISKQPIAKVVAKQIPGKAAKTSEDVMPKPPESKTVVKQKPSKATMELLKYHSFGCSETTTNPATQPTKTNVSKLPETTKLVTDSTMPLQLKESDTAKNTSIKQPKPQKPDNIAIMLKIKEAGSKRQMLLQQLQAIEEAIARKKQPTE